MMSESTGGPGRRVALISGGAHGYGRAIAARLARDGHDIAVIDLAEATETGALVEAAGARFLGVVGDITRRSDVDAAGDAVERAFGRVDILIANAGVYPIAPFLDTDWATWRRAMDVNVDGTFHLFQRFIPGMMARGWGRVVAMISGTFYAPPPNLAAYAASKGAVVGLVRGIAREVGAAGVTVNAVAPPLAETPGVAAGPQRRTGTFDIVLQMQSVKHEGVAEDIGGPISFLVSDDAHMITGQSIVADGGTHFL